MRKFFENAGNKFRTLKEFFGFLWARKLWWLIPMFILLFLVGTIVILGKASAIAPFIYTLF